MHEQPLSAEAVGHLQGFWRKWNPWSTASDEAVGHRNNFLKKRNPLKIKSWVQLHLYEKMTYKNSNVLEVIFKISIDSTQRGPIKSESVDANLLKSAYSAQLLEIHGFHFQGN